ncbi:hypothetical protein GUITHDRAFT_120296 [Guillardia theta CCMP2712]|uniref:Uncharacterized protein n=1 Tax=Guillardia theta (strain CCMP2712) TaxID=905079 RepID=L1IB55_GUITC|nr:hypothetical protein GUITHDRAFT_120296 [Guillardia theta CCMP2712]EKX33496.1 hypothetical protein GUITHDRAFT_120296 [Guillardia theta CCMP2712]|eukprot:XP_005820476.1 hypothetical protein GUITHDRAFT_120296 [Guillardia theta CCMP2712]
MSELQLSHVQKDHLSNMDGFDSKTKVVVSLVKLSELQRTNSLNIEKRLASREENHSLADEPQTEGTDDLAELYSSTNGSEQQGSPAPSYSSVSKVQFDARIESMRKDLMNLRNLGKTIRSSFNARAAEVMHTLESSSNKGSEREEPEEPPSLAAPMAQPMRGGREGAGGARKNLVRKHIRLQLEEELSSTTPKSPPYEMTRTFSPHDGRPAVLYRGGGTQGQEGLEVGGERTSLVGFFDAVAMLLIPMQESMKKFESPSNHAER